MVDHGYGRNVKALVVIQNSNMLDFCWGVMSCSSVMSLDYTCLLFPTFIFRPNDKIVSKCVYSDPSVKELRTLIYPKNLHGTSFGCSPGKELFSKRVLKKSLTDIGNLNMRTLIVFILNATAIFTHLLERLELVALLGAFKPPNCLKNPWRTLKDPFILNSYFPK